MSGGMTTMAILFADIAKSTALYDAFGNQTAQAIVNRCLDVLAHAAEHHMGTVVKTIGDEIMCTFPRAEDAVRAAKAMNNSLESLSFPEKPGFTAPNIYIGIQYGPVVLEGGDVFGDAVNVAARMVAFAKQRQIIAGQEVVDQLSARTRESVRPIEKTVVHGKRAEINIYEIVWEHQDVTVMLDAGVDLPVTRSRMELHLGEKVFSVDRSFPSASLGRQAHNDLVVNSARASRSHARVEYRRGKFVLIDQSTNGTYVTIQGKPTVQIKRDEFVLTDSGLIGLGQEARADAPDAIRFAVRRS